MRFILTLAIMPVLGLAFQTCSKSSTTTSNSVQNNTVATNNAAVKNANTTTSDHAEHSDEAPRITLEEAKKEFDKGTAVFIDTRAQSAYNVEHIKGAINIPAEAFETRYSEIPKDKKIIAYCS